MSVIKRSHKNSLNKNESVTVSVCFAAEDDSATEKETEMTSSAHERDKRSTGGNHVVSMTAENMLSNAAAADDDDFDDDDDGADDDAPVNRRMRLKRDLRDYLVMNRRWNDDGKTVPRLLQLRFLLFSRSYCNTQYAA